MIGNSYSSGTVSRLRGLLNAAPTPCQMTVTNITPGGQTMYGHSTTTSTLNTIANNSFSHVIIQEQSQHHGLAHRYGELYMGLTDAQNFFERYSQVWAPGESPNDDYPDNAVYWGTKAIIDAVKAGNSAAAQIHVFQSWGRDISDAGDVFWENGTDAEKVQRHLEQNIEIAQDMSFLDPDIKVARIGEAWKQSETVNPSINLYAGDGSHGNANGYFLSAAILYQQITGLPASENSYTGAVNATTLAALHSISDAYFTEPDFSLTSFKAEADGSLTIEWACRPCTEYYIEHSDTLETTDWSERVGTRVTTSRDEYLRSYNVFPSELKKFFRVVK